MKTKSPTGRARRPSYEFEKISLAVAEECAETGMAIEKFLALSPIEKRTRLKARMEKWGFTEDEIPTERVFRDYWNRLKAYQDRELGVLQEA
jgi:hypothetical protein